MSRAAVIIPTYQRGHMLADALASLDAQDEPCEVYVYDDGSTDDTAEIALAHGATYTRAPHGGSVTVARNAAVAWVLTITRAPYIAMLDSDDAYASDAVRRRADALDTGTCDMVFSGIRFCRAPLFAKREGLDRHIDISRYAPGDFDSFDRNVHTATVMMHRDLWIPWREEIRLGGADLLWVYEQVTRGLRVGYVDAILYYLRKHDGRNIARWRGTDDDVRQAERRVYRRLVREIREEHGYG